MKFLFDNTLPPKLAKALNIIAEPEHQIQHIREGSPVAVEDEDWIGGMSQGNQSIVVTVGLRIETNAHEIRALSQPGCRCLILKNGWIDMPFWRQMNILTKSFPKIIEAVQRMGSDQPLGLSTSGRVQQIRIAPLES